MADTKYPQSAGRTSTGTLTIRDSMKSPQVLRRAQKSIRAKRGTTSLQRSMLRVHCGIFLCGLQGTGVTSISSTRACAA